MATERISGRIPSPDVQLGVGYNSLWKVLQNASKSEVQQYWEE